MADSVALYRKYRSRSLEDLVGQDHITNTLKNAFKNEAISHAYLLTGPRGVGKTSTARIIAREVNNISHDDDQPYLDIIEIDAASNRRIEEVRELREKIHITPSQLKYKVYIIDEVHMLTKEAFNALLKTLEEPPAHALFVLATTEVHKLPDTIVSRTQRFSFRPVAKETIAKHLKNIAESESIKIDTEALDLLAQHADGSFRDAISLLDQAAHIHSGKISKEHVISLLGAADTSDIGKLADSVFQHDARLVFEHIESLLSKGVTPSMVAAQLASHWRNQLVQEGRSLSLIEAIERMLQVPISSDPRLQLEISLLKLAESSSASPKSETKQPTPPPNTPKESQQTFHSSTKVSKKVVEETERSKEAPETAEMTKEAIPVSVESLSESWPDVIKQAKSSSPSLHASLRQAALKKSATDKTQLAFKYQLHKRKVAKQSNYQALQSIFSEVIGHPIDIELIVDPNAFNTPEEPKPQTDGKIEKTAIERLNETVGGEIVRLT